MRLVDFFIDVIVFSRALSTQLAASDVAFESVRDGLIVKLMDSSSLAEKSGFSRELVSSAQFPVVAFIDELILCSKWTQKGRWQKESLQRKFYSTTNIGAEFYSKLNELSKHGPDESVREVYVLCLGLGFKGKYFSNDDRRALEDVKTFNLGLLLPQRTIEAATLFPTAYSGHTREGSSRFKTRLNIIPYVIGLPVVISFGVIIYYHFNLVRVLGQIINSVQ
jgi:type VI secretion system protein ImpK